MSRKPGFGLPEEPIAYPSSSLPSRLRIVLTAHRRAAPGRYRHAVRGGRLCMFAAWHRIATF